MHAKARHNDLGFTLIELLIIVILLGLLAAIVVFSVGEARDDAAEATCNTGMNSIKLAAEAYNTRVGHYPDTQSDMLGADGMLKALPDSDAYSVTYAPVGYSAGLPVVHATGFNLSVQDGAGNAVANCSAL